MGMGFVIRQVKMVIFKCEQVIHLGGQNHPRRRQRPSTKAPSISATLGAGAAPSSSSKAWAARATSPETPAPASGASRITESACPLASTRAPASRPDTAA